MAPAVRSVMLRGSRVAATVVVVLGWAGCGGSGGGAGTGGGTPAKGQQGGKVTVISAGDVDFVDPGRTYYSFGFMVSQATNRQLYSYAPGAGPAPVPDIAKDPPEISDDRRSITVKLRKHIDFSPPVKREVLAKDIKYAIERAFTRNVPNGYARTYFSDIVGAPTSQGAYRDIPGIETPDDHTLVLRLSRPSAVTVAAALALPITAPVPREYAEPFDQQTPSTYDDHVVFTGPYMIRNSAEGKLIGRRAGHSIDLMRNPNWDASTDFRPAFLDEIRIDEGNHDATASSRQILNGSGLVQGDGAVPGPVLTQALGRAGDQVAFIPGGNFRMIALNTKVAPFDNLDVRRAVVAAFNRDALRATRGGPVAGSVATHFLPPAMPGYDEGGGAQGPGLDFLSKPKGDLALARSYLRRAGYAAGRYDGPERPLMVGTNVDPGRATARQARAQLARLGFHVRLRLVSQDDLYTRYCGVPAARVAICPNVGAFSDFKDPEALLEPVFGAPQAHSTTDFSQLDDPQIRAAMRKAAVLAPGKDRNRAWGDIDRMIAAQAPGVPWLWDRIPLITSHDVHGVANEFTRSWDLSFSSLIGAQE